MTATDLYREGKLAAAIAAQLEAVRNAPADHGKRIFLFELLVFSGDLERAARQLSAVRYDEPELQAATSLYQRLLEAETLRRKLFSQGIAPKFVLEPPEHVKLRLGALEKERSGDPQGYAELLQQANEAVGPSGILNDKTAQDLRDCDDLFGPVLEVLANGEYAWVPLEQIDSLAMDPPRFPRDLFWIPARLEVDGRSLEVFLSAIYPGSQDSADEEILLGRKTDWAGEESGMPVRGMGAKAFFADGEMLGLLDWRRYSRS